MLIAQLEHQKALGNLTLQKLWFYIQPCMATLDTLASIVTSITRGQCEGGALLSLLHERTICALGDRFTQDICLQLVQAAGVPYFTMLEKWIYQGVVYDPYGEFLVAEDGPLGKEQMLASGDAYWEHHYRIVAERVPVFLLDIAAKILSTGKYLNVVRQVF